MAKALRKADASCAQDFVDALVKLQKDCNVDEVKIWREKISGNLF